MRKQAKCLFFRQIRHVYLVLMKKQANLCCCVLSVEEGSAQREERMDWVAATAYLLPNRNACVTQEACRCS